MKLSLAVLAALVFSMPAHGQSLSADDIARMLNEQAATPNPYAELLNDPDPARSMGAMKIMMESDDAALVDMALEFGLLSSDDRVQLAALDGYLATQPILLIRLDGSQVEDKDFRSGVTKGQNYGNFGGTVDENNIGYARLQVGKYDPSQFCYLGTVIETCLLTLNANGIFFTHSRNDGKVAITDEGTLAGNIVMYGVDERVPMTITLLD